MKWNDKKDELEDLILIKKIPYEEIGRMFNCSGNNIKKVAQRLGIEIVPKRKINESETFNRGTAKKGICQNCGKEFILYQGSKGKFCCSQCSNEFKHKENYKKFLEGNDDIMRANYSAKYFKSDILAEQGGVCDICKCKPEWNGKSLVFVLDHIDGHASNNRRENLRMICPNCDSQLPTYKSKNKNGDRYYYRYHKDKKLSE